MLKRCYFLFLISLLVSGPAIASDTEFATPRRIEVVLAMDESGSMKSNDPQRARIDAAQLFVSLMREGMKAGLVGFSTDADVRAAVSAAELEWIRASLRESIAETGQDGQWTHIGKALETSLGAFTPDAGAERYILLFTDGEVDVPGGQKAIAEARRKVRASILPRLQNSDVKVYTLAFTDNADLSLLRELAESTGGACFQGDDPEALSRLFLRMFETMARPQGLPIQKDSVLIDETVREATFVISRQPDSPPLRLITPGNLELTAIRSEEMADIHWFHASAFDVVTVSHPEPGRWRIDPEPTSDDRVHIVTDLQLRLDPPPMLLSTGQELPVEAWLASPDGVVSDPDLLSTLRFEAALQSEQNLNEFDLRPAKDGHYAGRTTAPDLEGAYRLRVLALGETFHRLNYVTLAVREQWVEAGLESVRGEPGEPIIMHAELKTDEHELERVDVHATVTSPDGRQSEIVVFPTGADLYANAFSKTRQPGEYKISIRLEAHDRLGGRIERTFGPFHYIAGARQVAAAVATATPRPTSQSTPAVTPTPTPDPTPAPTPEETPAPEQIAQAETGVEDPDEEGDATNWPLVGGILAFNAVLIGGGLYLIRRYRSAFSSEESLEDKLRKASDVEDPNLEATPELDDSGSPPAAENEQEQMHQARTVTEDHDSSSVEGEPVDGSRDSGESADSESEDSTTGDAGDSTSEEITDEEVSAVMSEREGEKDEEPDTKVDEESMEEPEPAQEPQQSEGGDEVEVSDEDESPESKVDEPIPNIRDSANEDEAIEEPVENAESRSTDESETPDEPDAGEDGEESPVEQTAARDEEQEEQEDQEDEEQPKRSATLDLTPEELAKTLEEPSNE